MSKRNLIGILHLILILLVFSSPAWLNWKLILLLWILNLFQIWIFGGCLLSQYQFKRKNQGFYRYYIDKFFPKNRIKEKYLNFFLDYLIPIILVIIAFIIQNR